MSKKAKPIHPLRLWRERQGLSQDDLAGTFGKSKVAISRIENGHRLPSLEFALDLEEYTGVKRWHFRPDVWGVGGKSPRE